MVQDFSHQQYHSTDQTTLRQPIIAQRYGNSVTLGCILEQENALLKLTCPPKKWACLRHFPYPFFRGQPKKKRKNPEIFTWNPQTNGKLFRIVGEISSSRVENLRFFGDGASKFSGKERYLFTWYPKQPFFIGCISWMMIPNLYIKKCLFTKQPLKKKLFRVF